MLKPRWRKVLYDLWGNKVRTLLVVASIAVGVFAIGVIVGTYAIISQDLPLSYSATNPPNISLITSSFDRDFVDAIRRVNGVADVEGRREVPVQLRLGPGKWDTLTLVAIPDFDTMHIQQQMLREGTAIPDDRQVVLEHKSLDKLNLKISDTLELELPDGTIRHMPIVGSVQDQGDVYGSILGDLRGFITFDTMEWLHQPLTLNRLYATVAEQADDKAHIQQVAQLLTDRVKDSGREVYRTEIALCTEHPLQSIIEALLYVLIILGVLVVFLSGSLIANTMSALLAQHLRQIGVMKLIGASRRQIIGMYLVLIAAFGIIALLPTVPLGSLGAYQLSLFVSTIINFEIQGFRVLPAAIFSQVIIALLVPPVAGLLPVLKGSRITVQKALASTGLEQPSRGTHKKNRADRHIERVQTPGRWQFKTISRPLLISIRNTFRRKSRLALTLFTLTLGGAVFIAVFNSQASLDRKMDQITHYFGADVNLDFSQSYRIEKVTQEVLTVDGVEGVEVWVTTSAEWVHGKNTTSDSLSIVAPPIKSQLVDPTLLQGRWLEPGDQNAITVNEAFLDDYPNLQAGDTLRLKIAGEEDDWTVVGIFQYSGLGNMVAYANYDDISRKLQDGQRASVYRVITTEHSLEFQKQVASRLSTHFRDLGYQVSKVEAGKAFNLSITAALGILTTVLLVMAILTALVGSIGLTGTMSMNVLERTREIGVMRAIGAHNQIVSTLVIIEGLIIGLISYIFGAVLSFPITFLLSNVIFLAIFKSPARIAFTAQGFLAWLGVVILLSIAASLLPARNASRLTIREVLAYE